MTNRRRAQRQWCPHGSGWPYWLAFLGFVVLLVSARAGVGLMPLHSPTSLAQVAMATTAQTVRMLPDLEQAELVVNTPYACMFQLIDVAGNPVPQAGISLSVDIIPPPPRRANSLPPSVTPTVLTTDANGQAAATLMVGHTSGSFQLLVQNETVAAHFNLIALPDRQGSRLIEVSGNNQQGNPGEVLPKPLVVRLEDQFVNPIPDEEITFTRHMGDGEFVATNAATLRTHAHRAMGPSGMTRQGPTVPPGVVSLPVSTDSEGRASVQYRPGQEPLQVVSAQAQLVPNDPVIFRINLGPLAGNGIQPANIVVGGGRGYTANLGTNNISVFDATGGSDTVIDAIDLGLVQTSFGYGGIQGVAIDTSANRLYVYAGVATSVYGGSVVLLVVDTVTNELVEPIDPDGDNWPGLTLFTTPEPPPRLQGFGNFVTVDATRRRVYAVVPVRDGNGWLMVMEDRGNAIAIVARIPVGEAPTGVAVNTRMNRIYVTNGGFDLSDTTNDPVTVVNGNDLAVIDTITVGRGPLGVKVDDRHDVIYVANLWGEETLESSGALSVINGATHTVVQTIPTAGITDLAVLVGAESDVLDDAIDRIYANDGTIIDCQVTDLTISIPCQVMPDYPGFSGGTSLAINDTRTLLFGTYIYDNAVTVFNLATNEVVGTIRTGVSVGGLAVDIQTATTYVSDWLGDRLFVIDSSSERAQPIDLWLEHRFDSPNQVEVDESNDRIYLLSTGSTPLIALERTTREQVATLRSGSGIFGWRNTLGIDERRNLLYIATASSVSNRLLVLDGAKLLGDIDPNNALLANIVIGLEDGTELAGGIAVDVERNLIYVGNFGSLSGCAPCSNALVVVRGPELDDATRIVLRAPEVVAEIPGIGLNYDGSSSHHNIALDLEHNLIYVAGAYGSVGAGEGFGGVDITVLDGLKIVDAQGQVTPNSAEAILGIIPIKMLGNLDIPITSDFGSTDMAFNAEESLLYVVTASAAPSSEGFISVINSDLVINDNREFNSKPHPDEPGTQISLIATLPAGIDPTFIALDTTHNRVMVSNQSLGALSVLQGLTMR